MNHFTKTICYMIIALLGFSTVYAQDNAPLPPKNLKASVEQTNAGLAVKLTWIRNDEGAKSDLYNVYSTFENTEKLQFIARVDAIEGKDEYMLYVHQLKAGIYHFLVKSAVKMNGALVESAESNIATIEIKGSDDREFKIVSQPPLNAKPGKDYIYDIKVISPVNCPVEYELINHPDNMYLKGNKVVWNPQMAGEYKISLRAFIADCDQKFEDVQSFVIRVSNDDQNKYFVKMKMEDAIAMKAGEILKYSIRYESNADCPVIFEFIGELPDGFKYSGMGVFVFNPSREGVFGFTVKARLECHPDVYDMKKFIIKVGEGVPDKQFCAFISGQVLYDDDSPVMEGMVNAWKLDRNSLNDKPYFKSAINQGQFKINLPQGNYALDISGHQFYAEWYEDAEYVTEAKRIMIACDEEKTINAVVSKIPEPNMYGITGSVYDAETNEPVYAMIEFIPAHNIFGDQKPDKDREIFVAKTDDSGNYSIELPDNFVYIAVATSMMNSKFYITNYYENAVTPMEADLIELNGNLSEINFAMKKQHDGEGGFTGMVKNKDGEPLMAKVIAHCIETKYDYFKEVQTVFATKTNEEGYFTFSHLIPGKYVVMSVPADRNYVPGYYKLNDYAVLKWKEATIIGVDEAMIDMIYEIKHRERGELGLVKIGGRIINKDGLIKQKGDNPLNAAPVAGAFITVADEEGNISDFGFSNSEGQFDLAEVSVGNQILVADKVGLETYEEFIKTDFEENSIIDLEFSMDQAVLDVADDAAQYNGVKVYPSPAEDNINIVFNSNSNIKTKLMIYNAIGLSVSTSDLDINQGLNIIPLNVSGLNSGTYFIRLEINGKQSIVPIQINR